MRYRIFSNGQEINMIEAGEAFVTTYCAKNGYTFEEEASAPTPAPEPEPTVEERLTDLEAALAAADVAAEVISADEYADYIGETYFSE